MRPTARALLPAVVLGLGAARPRPGRSACAATRWPRSRLRRAGRALGREHRAPVAQRRGPGVGRRQDAGRRHQAAGDALVIVLKLRDPKGRADGQIGRFLYATGAVRPQHVDGLALGVRLPHKGRLDLFGGVPVVPRLGAQAFDWVVGGRLGRSLGHFGVPASPTSSAARRAAGRPRGRRRFRHAVDSGLDFTARAAYDLVNPGPSEIHGALTTRRGKARLELFSQYRAPRTSCRRPRSSACSATRPRCAPASPCAGSRRPASTSMPAPRCARWAARPAASSGPRLPPSRRPRRGCGGARGAARGRARRALDRAARDRPRADHAAPRDHGEAELVIPDSDRRGRCAVVCRRPALLAPRRAGRRRPRSRPRQTPRTSRVSTCWRASRTPGSPRHEAPAPSPRLPRHPGHGRHPGGVRADARAQVGQAAPRLPAPGPPAHGRGLRRLPRGHGEGR